MASEQPRSYVDQVHRVRRLGNGLCTAEIPGPDLSLVEADRKAAALTETTNQIFEERSDPQHALHPTKASPGEELPPGYSRSYAGFFLCNLEREIEVDQDIITQEMDYLTQFMAIVCIIGGAPPHAQLPQWLSLLQRDFRYPLSLGRALGKGFYTIKTTDPEAVHNLMVLSPY
jgi:hypothetical protein